MGEFVGITPGPANALRGRMTKATSQANSIRGRLAADIAAAAGDWTGGTGAEALSRTASFLTTAERDLNWRITTITHAPGVKWDHGMATAQFAFADLAAAEAAGRAKGGELAKLWAQYKQDPTLANYNRFLAAMKVGEGDPGYDAGLLKGLGADNYRAIFEEWMKLKKDPTGHGVNPAELKQLIHDLGPLARALAVADVPDLRRNLLKKGSPDVISALLVMTPQSKEFVVEAGKYLAGAVTNHTTDPNWNLRWLYTALDQNPVAFQAVLASSLETANRLLSPTVLGEGDIRDLTTRAITKAMNEGLNDPTRRQAIANIAGSFSPGIDRNPQLRAALVAALTRELDNQPTRRDFFQKLVRSLAAAGKPAPALREKDINQLFARHLVSFLPEISGLEATRNDPNLKMDPGDGWSLVSHDDLVNVINGVIIDPDGYKTLRNGLYRFQSTLDKGTGDINDPKQRDLV
ncbi:MAG: hypothetical protein HOY71_53350, partial [Nonomuraea sp.]|nr:hypothetical protein [Nonomuraea sp.]